MEKIMNRFPWFLPILACITLICVGHLLFSYAEKNSFVGSAEASSKDDPSVINASIKDIRQNIEDIQKILVFYNERMKAIEQRAKEHEIILENLNIGYHGDKQVGENEIRVLKGEVTILKEKVRDLQEEVRQLKSRRP